MITNGRRAALLASAAMAFGMTGSAWAQTVPAAAGPVQADGTKGDSGADIVVTGSRIARRVSDTLQPTVTTPAQKIEDSGFTNLGNVIRQNPLFEAYDQTTGDRGSRNQNGGDAGVTFANLYNLGSQRTLTLIDGKRVVGAASPNGSGANGLQVDISSIPTGLVDRIETVSIGGAPIYGSDAIAGTVNVILKDNFQGVNVDVQGGYTFGNRDGGNYRAQLLVGQNFAGGRGNVTLAVAHTQQDRVSGADRGFNIPFGNTNAPDGSGANVPFYNAGYAFLSGYGRPALFLGGITNAGTPAGFYTNNAGQPLTFDQTGNLVPFTAAPGGFPYKFPFLPGMPTANLVVNLPASDLDTTRQQNDVISPSNRTFAFGTAHYDVTDHVTLWARGQFTRTNAKFITVAPSQSALNGDPAGMPVAISPATNPFLTPSTRAFFLANPTVFGTTFYLNREFTDLAGDLTRSTQETYTVQAGLKGDFGFLGGRFRWDLTGSVGRTERNISTPAILGANLLRAEDAVYANAGLTTVLPVPATLNIANFTYDASAHLYRENGTGNVIACRVRVAGQPAGGASAADVSTCAPLNPFGNQVTADAAGYVRVNAQTQSIIKQRYVEGNVGGDLFGLPAGKVSANIGFQIRREEASFALDAYQTTPFATGSRSSQLLQGAVGAPVTGAFTTKELYGETRIPIINHDMVSFIDDLSAEGSVRQMWNSLAGNDTTWTAGGRLRILGGLTFRGNKTRSVRQPAIAELFAGTLPTTSSVTDPCANNLIDTGPNPAQRRANCVALVVASGAAANPTAATNFLSTYTAMLGAIPGTTSGNPNLTSEKADSWTAGIVLEPRFLPRFVLSADYLQIKINGAISSLNGSGVAAACVDTTNTINNFYCAAAPRGNTFRVTSFTAFQANTSLLDFEGVTAQLRYGPVPLGRDIAVTFDGTLLRTLHSRSGVTAATVTDALGGIGNEKWRANGGVNLRVGQFTAYLQETYYAPAALDPINTTIFRYNRVPAYYLTDLALNYRLTPNARLQVTVNNLLAVKPPFNAFSYQYDQIGRRFLIGANVTF